MTRKRTGFTLIEVVVAFLVIAVLVGGGFLWNRVTKLNTWAVATDHWLVDELYPWIKDQNFQVGPEGGGAPDGNKPPPPPDGL